MAFIDDVKAALRVTTTNAGIVAEVTDLIASAKADLALTGVIPAKSILETDALIKRAIITYCKANFGYDNPDAERLQKSYEMLRDHLTLSMDYAYFTVTFTVKDAATAAAIRGATVVFDDETLTTNASGVAVFYVQAGANYYYTVSADGYTPDADAANLVDVTASVAVSINMTGA